MNAPAAGVQFPLVVISHGGGGSSLTYRGLACHLVRAGYVVALLEHPGNNRIDNPLEGTTANLENRPRHICIVIDAAFADEAVGGWVRALVLLAPACGWFGSDGALADVDVPILLRTGEKDELEHHLHTGLIQRGVRDPRRVDHRVVPNAGHHAFQSPFPQAMSGPHFPPSQDPVGFDRAKFQPLLYAEIRSFLDGVL